MFQQTVMITERLALLKYVSNLLSIKFDLIKDKDNR